MAGIMEGEGSFRLQRNIVNGKLYHYPQLIVRMTDKDVIEKMASFFSTKTHQFENGRRIDGTKGLPIYSTSVNGTRAANFMRALLPFMGERRSAKIEEILAIHDTRPDPNNARRIASRKSAMKRWHGDEAS